MSLWRKLHYILRFKQFYTAVSNKSPPFSAQNEGKIQGQGEKGTLASPLFMNKYHPTKIGKKVEKSGSD